jgi:hypothetical protein
MALLRRPPSLRFMLVFLAFALLFTFQTVQLSFFAVVTILGFLTKLFIAAATMETVRNFRFAFVRCMVWITKLSLFFYVPVLLASFVNVPLHRLFQPFADFVGVAQYGVLERVNIGLYNFQTGENLTRNAAFFWEPGAFSGYLVLALLFLATLRADLPGRLRRRWGIWLVLGIVTSQSSAGLITLPFVLVLFLISHRMTLQAVANNAFRIGVALAVLVPLSVFVWQLDFVGSKISELYSRAVFQEKGWELSRFGSILFDWAYITERPILGWGQNNATQFALSPGLDRMALGNGFSGYVRQLGLFGLTILLVSLWAGLRQCRLGPRTSAWFVFVVLLILNGQYFMDYPLFLGLHFLGARAARPSPAPVPPHRMPHMQWSPG